MNQGINMQGRGSSLYNQKHRKALVGPLTTCGTYYDDLTIHWIEFIDKINSVKIILSQLYWPFNFKRFSGSNSGERELLNVLIKLKYQYNSDRDDCVYWMIFSMNYIGSKVLTSE